MGNSIGGGRKKRTAKIMKIDGTTFRLKPPVQASDVLRDHPGHDLLESEDVKRLGLRAQPLHPDHPLSSGKLYFLIELPRMPDQTGAAPRRAWSGALHVSARERLESLKLTRRSASDLSVLSKASVEEAEGGMRVRMRLPKAEVARVVEGSRDSAEAAQKIMELCMARERDEAAAAAAPVKRRKEVRLIINVFPFFGKKKKFFFFPEFELVIITYLSMEILSVFLNLVYYYQTGIEFVLV